jgi:hypothetical protein
MHLLDGAMGIRRVMQHPPRVDEIKTLRLKRQRFRVRNEKIGLKVFEFEAFANERDRCFCEIDSSQFRTRAGEADEVGARANADLQHPTPSPALEVGKSWNKRLKPVPCLLDLGKKLR